MNNKEDQEVQNLGSPQLIIIKLEDVHLDRTENAWYQNHKVSLPQLPTKDKELLLFKRKITGLLNRLSSGNFEKVKKCLISLNINSEKKLQALVDLIIDRACNEPMFSELYARLCKAIKNLEVVEDERKIRFKKLLIVSAGVNFEIIGSIEKEKLSKRLIDCLHPAEKEAILDKLNHYDDKCRLRRLCNIKFIGELWKIKMFPMPIIAKLIDEILENQDENGLECICMILVVMGKELDRRKVNVENLYHLMKCMVEKEINVPSRLRFKALDILEYKASGFTRERTHLNNLPKIACF